MRGEASIRGIRTKAAGSKTGVRPWVASYLGTCPENDDWLPTLVRLLQESHGAGWMSHDHLGKSFSRDGRTPTANIPQFSHDVSVVRELLTEALAEGVDLGMSPDEAQRARWHGAKSTITSIMMHLELGERAIRFSGNWRSAVEAMPDRYLKESQVMVLKAQEEALKFIRAGGDLGVLEGIPVGRGGEQHFNVLLTEAAHRMRSDAARMDIKGLAPADVAPELSSREVSLGAMAAAGDLDSEKGDMEQANDFEAVLDRQPEPSDESLDLSTGETSDSEAGIYLTHFVQVSRTSHVLHKPREGEPGKRMVWHRWKDTLSPASR